MRRLSDLLNGVRAFAGTTPQAFATFVLGLGLLAPLQAAALADADVAAIRAAIARQLDSALVCDRAVKPASVSFLELVVMSGEAVQQVRVTDRGGAVWVAYYGMQRQDDGSWRTSACRLVQPNRSISA